MSVHLLAHPIGILGGYILASGLSPACINDGVNGLGIRV